MKPTCIYIFILWVLLVWQDRVDCYATGTGRSRVIACHSRDIENMLLYHYHLENINGVKEKWWPGRDMAWVLVGVRGCVTVDAGHSLVTLLSLSVLVEDRSLHKPSRQVTDLLSRAHTWLWTLGRLVSLSSWVPVLSGPTVRVPFWWRRSLHRTESGTQGRGLGVQVWMRT